MELDLGGLATLIVALSLLLFFQFIRGKRPKDLKAFIAELNITSAILLVVGIIAFWLTIRVTGLYFISYLTIERYPYSQFDIFAILAYALSTNLCFTLSKYLKEEKEKGASNGEKIKSIINATMQAVLIGILTFLPHWSNKEMLPILGGSLGFTVILLGMVLTLLVLELTRERFKE